jgi:Ca2+-binding RTX toxin-like protein
MWIRTNSAIGVCAAVAATLVGLGLAASTSAAAAGTHRPRCHGQRATIVGTRHRDVIHGTDKRDVIVAGGGWDRIYGNGGSDLICAGRGADVIFPGRGNDWVDAGHDGMLYGEDEVGDKVFASHGNDVMFGGPGLGSGRGLDQLIYYWAKHRVRIDLAAHLARIGNEHDQVHGFEIVQGTNHDDVIFGTGGFEEIYGRGGDDIIKGRGGIDFINGGGGDDRLSSGRGNDALSGGRGYDIGHAGTGDDYCNTLERVSGCEHLTK